MRRIRWHSIILLVCTLVGLGVTPSLAQRQPPSAEVAKPNAPDSATGGSSMYVNGSNYAVVPHYSLPALGDVTLEAWIFPNRVANCNAVFGKDYAQGLWFGICNGKLRFHHGSAASFADSTNAIPTGTWTHIAVTAWYDPYEDKYLVEFYINGDHDSYNFIANTPIAGTRELRIGNDQPWDFFWGDIAEARIWSTAKGEYSIRELMHTAFDGMRPGLVANWHLAGDFKDTSGNNRHASGVGSPQFNGYASPAAQPTTPVDEFFNLLPEPMYGAGTAYIPSTNMALLIGGYRNGAPSNKISQIDAGSGASLPLGTLPVALGLPSAAYASANDTVYLFGGSTDTADTTVNTIYAITPNTGAVRTLSATLPQSLYLASAVYQPTLNKIVLIGGYRLPEGSLNTIYVFDVATETISTATTTLPQAMYGMPAIYSTATDTIYLFGGSNLSTSFDTIMQLSLAADNSVTLTPLSAKLPKADGRTFGFEDPISKLIYVAGGSMTTNVLAFDPQTNEIWRTPVQMPTDPQNTAEVYLPPASKIRSYATAVYSPRNRHALVFGGDNFGGTGRNNVWRILLGNGPLVKLGQWDFIYFASSTVTALDGNERAVVVGTTSGAWQLYNYANNAQPNEIFHDLGGAATAVAWDREGARPYFGANNKVFLGWSSGAVTQLYDLAFAIMSIEPIGSNSPPLFGAQTVNRGANYIPSLYAPKGPLSSYTYNGYGPNCSYTSSIKYKGFNINTFQHEYWAINTPYSCGLPRPAANQPEAVNAYNQARFVRLRRSVFSTGTWSQTDLGVVCDNNLIGATKLAFSASGDLWIAGFGGMCRYPAANLPGSANPQYNVYDLPYAVNSNNVSVDNDGRIWFSTGGGLSVFETRKDANVSGSALRASDFNRLNAPIGRLDGSSLLDSLATVGEKVFASRTGSHTLFQYSPRWAGVTGNLAGSPIKKIWAVRGRLFAASNSHLHVLQPDGASWDSTNINVNAVMADTNGKIWLATDTGVQTWQPNGTWQAIPNMNLNEPVHALTQDNTGRVWLGLNDGVAMYDRQRLVTRIALPTGAVAVTSLYAQPDGVVWAGTSTGLARFDPATATWTRYSSLNGMPFQDDVVVDIAQRNDGTMFVTTTKSVLKSASDPNAIAFTLVSTNGNLPLTTDELGRMWAGNSVETAPNTWQWYYWTNSGIRSATVSDITADQADRVWMVSPNGEISVRGSFLPPLDDEVPTITSIAPTSGSVDDTITISGSGFGSDPNAVSVMIGGVNTPISSVSGGSISVRLTRDNITGNVTVRRGKRAATFGGATPAFCARPRIYSFSPTGGNIGVKVEIHGSNFDPQAHFRIGNGILTRGFGTPILAQMIVESSDTSGNIMAVNQCTGMVAASSQTFQKMNVSIARVTLNQGYPQLPLMRSNATLASAFLNVTPAPRAGMNDVVQLDWMGVELTPAGSNTPFLYGASIKNAPPFSTNGVNDATVRDIANAVNIPNIIYYGSGLTNLETSVRNNGRLVANTSYPVYFRDAKPVQILLVPIMPDGYTAQQLRDFIASVNTNLTDYRFRIFPGGVKPVWADAVIEKSTITSDPRIDMGSSWQWGTAGRRFEEARHSYNRLHRNNPIGIAFGAVHPTIATGPGGMASFGISSWWIAEQACVAAKTGFALINPLSLLVECGDNPKYLGWAVGNSSSSRLFAHELAHMMGLIDDDAANYAEYDLDGGDNHSAASELRDAANNPVECGKAGAIFDMQRSLYRSAGISEPIVNPISGNQLARQNGGNQDTARAKALLSYACARDGWNTFFEPSDYNYLLAERYNDLRPFYVPADRPAQRASNRPATPTEQLQVTGLITDHAGMVSGTINQLVATTSSLPPGLNMVSDYQLIQYNASGTELDRQGVSFISPSHLKPHDHSANRPVHGSDTNIGVFSAMLPKMTGVARVDLVHAGATLASFSAGDGTPTVSISSPSGGETFNDGDLTVTWNASDPDGDPLVASVEYSHDGTNWTPIASTSSNSATVPVGQLGGGDQAQVRVWVSDGFHSASATSNPFSVAKQAPIPFIIAPSNGSTVLEGQAAALLGRADDLQDGVLSDTTSLLWTSDLDGVLGSGEAINPVLSVGTHTITLQATNSAGMSATTSITLIVQPDYDGDLISDDQENSLALNPLTPVDVQSDADGDGLSWLVERNRETDPTKADTDGDGRSDSDEVANGSNPMLVDSEIPNLLTVAPVSMTFDVDLNQNIQLPQQMLEALSHVSVPITLTTDVDWLDFSDTTGNTNFVSTVVLNPIKLKNGTQTGTITVQSSIGTVNIPVTVNASNKANFCDANGNGTLNNADIAAIQARIGARYGDANYLLDYDLNRDGVIDANDVQAAQSCVTEINGGTNYQLFLPLVQR